MLPAQSPLIHAASQRAGTSLDGHWHYLIDPYETGYRNHRDWMPFDQKEATKASASPYYLNQKALAPGDRVEYDFDAAPTLHVPGDWNHQQSELLYYEGTVWYKTDFQYTPQAGVRPFLYFGAANYRADVYLNGQKVGIHLGGYDPFNMEISEQVQAGENTLIVRVDNRRAADRVPTLTTDWWNYGGLTRSVRLLDLPQTFIRDYHLQLDPNRPDVLRGYVQVDQAKPGQKATLSIPELAISQTVTLDQQGYANLEIKAKNLVRWYPERPKLYALSLATEADTLRDQVGFRTITTEGTDILLNGKKLFLRGISLHEEVPQRQGRAWSREDARMLLGWAQELNCNMVRLAHYPHNEHMARLADEMGLLLWEEIPVYWGIDYENADTYAQAENQLRTLISRDKNRASVIIWSVANETPREDPQRLAFLKKMRDCARGLDPDRLISAALDRTEDKEKAYVSITDPFAEVADLISCNEYIGWYGSTPSRCTETTWDLSGHDKPFFISEFGGGALYNYHGPREQRWTEEYQAWLYQETLTMLDQIPSLRGMTPWILVDFRSPRRNLSGIQDGWNRKGLLSDQGHKKQAWYILQAYYAQKAEEYRYEID